MSWIAEVHESAAEGRPKEYYEQIMKALSPAPRRVPPHARRRPRARPPARDRLRRGPLPPADRAIGDYALKLTRGPRAMTRADVEALHGHAFSDAEIFEIAFTTAYFNYTNRVAEGPGVEPEPE